MVITINYLSDDLQELKKMRSGELQHRLPVPGPAAPFARPQTRGTICSALLAATVNCWGRNREIHLQSSSTQRKNREKKWHIWVFKIFPDISWLFATETIKSLMFCNMGFNPPPPPGVHNVFQALLHYFALSDLIPSCMLLTVPMPSLI